MWKTTIRIMVGRSERIGQPSIVLFSLQSGLGQHTVLDKHLIRGGETVSLDWTACNQTVWTCWTTPNWWQILSSESNSHQGGRMVWNKPASDSTRRVGSTVSRMMWLEQTLRVRQQIHYGGVTVWTCWNRLQLTGLGLTSCVRQRMSLSHVRTIWTSWIACV